MQTLTHFLVWILDTICGDFAGNNNNIIIFIYIAP